MKKFLRLFGVVCLLMGSAGAFDLPTFYRVPFFQTDVTQKTKDWTTTVNARFASGDTRQAFDFHEHKTALFNANGPFDVARLGLDLENLSATNKPQTNAFWGTGGTWSRANVGAGTAGLVEFGGRFRNTEIDFELTQNLLWGFYVHVYAPYKDVVLDMITKKVVGAATIGGQSIATFVDNTLPTILTENGFKKPFAEPFKKQAFGDVTVSAGWHKYKEGLSGIVSTLGGCVQVGVLLPVAPRVDQDRVFSVPLGYDQHLGVVVRAAGQATFWKMITVGVQAGSIIFIEETKTLRMLTDKNQNGWIKLEKGRAQVDQGSLWDIGAYVKADQFVKGFAATIGASFTTQEPTVLTVHDDTFLKTARDNAAKPDANRVVPGFISVDDVVNADKQLRGWETYALHFVAEYDAGTVLKTSFAPFIRFAYDYPLLGKLSWPAAMLSGTAGLSVSWNF